MTFLRFKWALGEIDGIYDSFVTMSVWVEGWHLVSKKIILGDGIMTIVLFGEILLVGQ